MRRLAKVDETGSMQTVSALEGDRPLKSFDWHIYPDMRMQEKIHLHCHHNIKYIRLLLI